MRTTDFGESDLLVHFFTSDKGRQKGVAKGARRSRKRFANCLDLFCLTNLEYGLKKKGDLYFLNSGKLIHAFPGLRSDFYSLSLASYMIELTEILFPHDVIDNNMFELLKNSFFALHEGQKKVVLRIIFEARAMTLGGYGINFETCCKCGRPYTGTGRGVFIQTMGAIACLNCEKVTDHCPGMGPDAAKKLKKIQFGSWNNAADIFLCEKDIQEIMHVMKQHIQYRIGKKLKSTKYLDR